MILYDYAKFNRWANDQIFSLIEKEITEEYLDKKIVSSFPTLRKTIYHIWDAEFIWLKRLNGQSLSDWPSKNFNGKFSEAKKKILSIDDDFIDYVSKIDDQKANSSFTYRNIEGKTFTNQLWQSIHHCMNHSTYHRGQVVTIMRQLGVTNVPSTDFITYCRIGK
jgi:uncharacterized damage-inducible protein DinB